MGRASSAWYPELPLEVDSHELALRVDTYMALAHILEFGFSKLVGQSAMLQGRRHTRMVNAQDVAKLAVGELGRLTAKLQEESVSLLLVENSTGQLASMLPLSIHLIDH